MIDFYPLIIGGNESDSGERIDVIDKYSLEPFASVCSATDGDIEAAVAGASAAAAAMRDLTAHQRSRIIRNTARLIEERKEKFTTIITREAGKPRKYAGAEVERCIENISYASEEAKRIHGETVPLDASSAGSGRKGYFERYPLGPVLAISPFNFPLNLAAHKLAPAIAAGNSVVLKPATLTPLAGVELVRCFVDGGCPPGSISVLVGSGRTVGSKLIKDDRFSKISFTGSREVGETITRNAGLKKLTMELGANCGLVIDDDVDDLDFALKRALLGAFYYQGQVCISVQRIFVHRKRFDEFSDKLIKATKLLKIGNPLDGETDIGPIISVEEATRIESWINEAVASGAEILCGGKRKGHIIEPTVIGNTRSDMKVVSQELFGPAVVLIPVDSFEEGVSLCDQSSYGLQAGVFTARISHALHAINSLNVGGVIVNDIPSFRVDHMPYGGNKGSGLGREGARFAIEEMTAIRMVVFNQQDTLKQ